MSDLSASFGGAAETGAGGAPAPGASARAEPALTVSFIDGLAPIAIGLLWLLTQLLLPLGFNLLAEQRAAAAEGLGPFLLLALDETRSTTLWEAALPILLFAGFARAATPWAAGRRDLAAPWLGVLGCAVLSAAYAAWIGLTVSLAVPGLWPNPLDLETLAISTPRAVYWADLGVLAALYAALIVFAGQILLTLGLGLRSRMVGPAALALAVASALAIAALPDDLRHRWSTLTAQSAGLAATGEPAGEVEGLGAQAIVRLDGLYYVYDQIALTVLDFIAIAAAMGVLIVAVWRASGGVLRWNWLACAGVLSFASGAGFTLLNLGFERAESMAVCLNLAALACLAPLLLLPLAWIRSLDDPQARRDAPAWWALAALAPSGIAAIAVPALAAKLGDAVGPFDLWLAAFNVLDLAPLSLVCFAGWYALQHRLTGSETGRTWSVGHLLAALLLSAGAAFGPYYSVFFLGTIAEWTTSWGDEPAAATAGRALFLTVLFGEYVIFAFGLLSARSLPLSRMETAAADELAVASRSASAAKPKLAFKRKTLFEKKAGAAEMGAAEPPILAAPPPLVAPAAAEATEEAAPSTPTTPFEPEVSAPGEVQAPEASAAEPEPAAEASAPEPAPAPEASAAEPEPAPEASAPEPEPAPEAAATEPEPAPEASAEEPETAAEASAPEPEPAPEASAAEPEPAPEAAAPEPEPAREASAAEPEPAAEAAALEPEPAPEAAAPELEPAPEASAPEPEPAPEASAPEPEPAAEASAVEPEPAAEASAVEPEPAPDASAPEPETAAEASAAEAAMAESEATVEFEPEFEAVGEAGSADDSDHDQAVPEEPAVVDTHGEPGRKAGAE